MTTFLKSARGFPLVFGHGNFRSSVPVLTCELYDKWYTLHLVHPDGRVEEVCFPGADDRFPDSMVTPGASGFCDHVPNPTEVQRMAEHLGWEVDQCSLEMMVGRWEIEYRNNYGGC